MARLGTRSRSLEDRSELLHEVLIRPSGIQKLLSEGVDRLALSRLLHVFHSQNGRRHPFRKFFLGQLFLPGSSGYLHIFHWLHVLGEQGHDVIVGHRLWTSHRVDSVHVKDRV